MNVGAVVGGGGAAAGAVSPRIHQAAVQFEAMLLQQLTKPLTSGFSSEDEESGEVREAGPLQSFAGEAVASSLAKSGALGFARQIEETLAKSASKKCLKTAQVLKGAADKADREERLCRT